MDIGVNKFSFTEKEINQVEKSLGLVLSDRDKELLMSDRFSGLIEFNSNDERTKKGKLHLFREKNGDVSVTVNYMKETLVIPEKIEGYNLSPEDKLSLKEGGVIQIKNKKQNLYVQVDKELNAIVIKGDKEIGVPEKIGGNKKNNYEGYTLTDQDKSRLANGGILEPKVLCGDKGYFLANFSMSDDQKGFVLYDYQTIPENKVSEFIKKYNHPQENIRETPGQEQGMSPETKPEKEKVVRNLDEEFNQALDKRDFEKLNNLANEGYKPADIQIEKIETLSGLTEHEKTAVKTIFKVDEDSPSLKPAEDKNKEAGIHIKKEENKTTLKDQEKEYKEKNGRTEKIGRVLNQAFTQM